MEIEILSQLAEIAPELTFTLFAAIAVGSLRCGIGWFEKASADGKIERFEIIYLFRTMLKYFMWIFLLGFVLPPETAIGATFSIDVAPGVVGKVVGKIHKAQGK